MRVRYPCGVAALPESLRWLFWDVAFDALDPETQAEAVLGRALENGRLEDVRAVLAFYGPERVHRFFREVAHPLISERTRTFWRAYFNAEGETWASPPDFRKSSYRGLR